MIESLPETQKALSPTWSVVATPKIPAFGGMKAGDPEVQDHLLRESKASLDYEAMLKKNIKHLSLSLSLKKWE